MTRAYAGLLALMLISQYVCGAEATLMSRVAYEYSGGGVPAIRFVDDGNRIWRTFSGSNRVSPNDTRGYLLAFSQCSISNNAIACSQAVDFKKPVLLFPAAGDDLSSLGGQPHPVASLIPGWMSISYSEGKHVIFTHADGKSKLRRLALSGGYVFVRAFDDKFVVRTDPMDGDYSARLAVFSKEGTLLGTRRYDSRSLPDAPLLTFRDEFLALTGAGVGYSLVRGDRNATSSKVCRFFLPTFPAAGKEQCAQVELAARVEVMAIAVDDKEQRFVVDWYDYGANQNYVSMFVLQMN